jgi:hypothetical protein
VGQLETGATFEFATKYHDIRKVVPRHSHYYYCVRNNNLV